MNLNLIYMCIGAGVLALVFAWIKSIWINKQDPGTEKMQEIGAAVREGAMAFLSREYRVLAIFVGVIILFEGGTQLGLPLYGLLAGLGVGGLAVALAAQNTLENFMGSLNLFVDRPVRVGELCRYGEEMGTVEEIGARSTRIRGLDRTVTIIPNADFSRMKIVNYTRRDQMFMRPTLRLRYETSNEQLRCILAKIRELLLADPRVSDDPLRVRFVAYGEYSINLEIFAYVLTPDANEFFGIQEEIFLRIKNIVEEAGTAFALAPRTVS